ncbi:MAG: hypothetical protein WC843_05705 [Candidatus Gracilibacteria bacterium]|jgi:hypothetical protein
MKLSTIYNAALEKADADAAEVMMRMSPKLGLSNLDDLQGKKNRQEALERVNFVYNLSGPIGKIGFRVIEEIRAIDWGDRMEEFHGINQQEWYKELGNFQKN